MTSSKDSPLTEYFLRLIEYLDSIFCQFMYKVIAVITVMIMSGCILYSTLLLFCLYCNSVIVSSLLIYPINSKEKHFSV